jgi:PKD repeat protein
MRKLLTLFGLILYSYLITFGAPVDEESARRLAGNFYFERSHGASLRLMPPATQTPVAGFAASPTTVSAGLPVSFTNQSTGYLNSWRWFFGDGDSSTAENPTHICQQQGTYSVTLIAGNIAGSDTLEKVNYITVTGPVPTVDFTASPLFAYPGDTIFFTDLTGNSPLTWSWHFGDGDTSDLQHPWHVYKNPGAYTVTLETENVNGSSQMTKPYYIFILTLPPLPMAYFAASQTTILAGQTVEFTDYSFSNPFEWAWIFPGGDPPAASGQNPSPVRYDVPGVWDVMLVVTNLSGSDTMLRKDYIVVGNPGIEELQPTLHHVYPVPAGDVVHIRPGASLAGVFLTDITGRTVLERQISSSAEEIIHLPVAGLPEGTYILVLKSLYTSTYQKVIIAR